MSIKIDDIYCKHLLKFTMKYKSKKHFFLDKFHIVLCIADSIHYNSLLHNDFSDYEKLLKTSYQPEHSLNNFKELINAFDIHKMGKIKLIHNMQLNKYIICDVFKHITDKSVVKLDSSNIGHEKRIVGVYNLSYAENKNDNSGLKTIHNLQYGIEKIEDNVIIINVTNFKTERNIKNEKFKENIQSEDIVADNNKRLLQKTRNIHPFFPMNIKQKPKKKRRNPKTYNFLKKYKN